MKIINLFALILIIPLFANSQSRSFNDFIIAASSKTNPTIILENFKKVGGSERFFSDTWCDGYAVPVNGEIVAQNTRFNYDYEEKTLYLKTLKNEIISINMNSVKTFGLINEKKDTIHFRLVNTGKSNEFCEIIGGNSNSEVAVLKLKNPEFRKADKTEYIRNYSGDYSGTYITKVEYILFDKSRETKKIKSLKKEDLSAYFTEYKSKINRAGKNDKKLTENELKELFADIIKQKPKNI